MQVCPWFIASSIRCDKIQQLKLQRYFTLVYGAQLWEDALL